MACFAVPAAEAIIVGTAYLVAKHKEKKIEAPTFTYEAKDGSLVTGKKVKLSTKLSWLLSLLTGGAFLLAYEHVWHGEVVPWFPFLTNAANPADAQVMLHEMATVGVLMAVLVTLIWAVMLGVCSLIEKRARASATAKSTQK